MSRAALYAEQRIKIPIIDPATHLWHVRYTIEHSWTDKSFNTLKEATRFYDEKYKTLLEEYKILHSSNILIPQHIKGA